MRGRVALSFGNGTIAPTQSGEEITFIPLLQPWRRFGMAHLLLALIVDEGSKHDNKKDILRVVFFEQNS